MLLLTSLADEILLLILSYFSTDLLTLCNLAVSSQRFNDLATPIIYYDINLCQSHSIVSTSFSTRLKQLHRTINERPTLAPLLRRLRLTWRNEQCQEALKNFNKLRAKLHWLRELELTISGTINLRFGPKSQKPNALEWSKEIKMPDGNLQINDIVEYLLLPDLKAMHIDCIDTRTSLTEILQHPSRHARHDQSLSLATLSFGLFHPHPKILLEILRLSPNLRELCCWIPGDDGHDGHWRGVRVYNVTMISVLSPARIPVLLEPIQHSLRSLNLGEATQTEWPHHDGSRMDMSSFSCLKVLKTVAKCMFSAKSPDDGRKGVYRLLPPTLEELDIWFGFCWDLLYNAARKSEWEQFEANGQDVDSDKYAWLAEIVEYKHCYPSLRRVVITEQVRHPRAWGFDRISWGIPSRLRTLFENADVDLKVWIRTPLEGKFIWP